MSDQQETPFESVESAQQFVQLLCESIEEARREIEEEVARPQPDRRTQALQLVGYNLAKLAVHLETSQRILNDLRSLRRLLFQERAIREGPDGEEVEVRQPLEAADAAGFAD
jgi:hypothetical protein